MSKLRAALTTNLESKNFVEVEESRFVERDCMSVTSEGSGCSPLVSDEIPRRRLAESAERPEFLDDH